MTNKEKDSLIDILAGCFAEEIEHLKLRVIRDTQAPRFKALEKSHPEIYSDFMKARTSCHEKLLKIRRKRQNILIKIIEK